MAGWNLGVEDTDDDLCVYKVLDTTVTNKSLNISAFLARRDTWFGMADFFVSP